MRWRLGLWVAVVCVLAAGGCGRIYYDPVGGCTQDMTPGTLALYSFEGVDGATAVVDRAGNHDGVMANGPAMVTAGPTGCGDALALPASGTPNYFVIPNSLDWALDQGSVAFWVRFASTGAAGGVVSRDAFGVARPGHLSIVRAGDGSLAVRLQAGGMPFGSVRCSTGPVPDDTWIHVVVNFGPPDLTLVIDGALQTRGPGAGLWLGQCGTATWAAGISGNSNPWVVGASTAGRSGEGVAEPTDTHLFGAAIDQLRISSARRAL